MGSRSDLESVRSVWTSDEGSMAQETAAHRWPVIVQGMIHDVQLTCDDQSTHIRKLEGSKIIRKLSDLRHDIIADSVLKSLETKDAPQDLLCYNEELSNLGACSWRNCPWLFGECYLYRYVQTIFHNSQEWKDYDVFNRQKESTLLMSRLAVEELAHQFVSTVLPPSGKAKSTVALGNAPHDAAEVIFREMTELALWGNATDLSLLTNLTIKEIQQLQTKKVADDRERSIVNNSWVDAWKLLRHGQGTGTPRRVDIILDNAGFELFTDVLYAAYMLETDLATEVVLHAKSFPWFVSDVTPRDFYQLIKNLNDQDAFPKREDLDRLTTCLKAHLNKGSIKLQYHAFWTTHFSFDSLPKEAPELMQYFQGSYLTIWKGDLNYRKLTRDGLWPHTTTFKTALGRLGQGSGIKIFALRTNKSDTCVGVSAKRLEELEKEEPEKAWVRNGKYAVISFSDGT